MHTDEYEISLNRECNHCQSVVNKVRQVLQQRQQSFGLDYEEVIQARQRGSVNISDEELAKWQEDLEALPVWEQRLREYRELLAAMRISTPGVD